MKRTRLPMPGLQSSCLLILVAIVCLASVPALVSALDPLTAAEDTTLVATEPADDPPLKPEKTGADTALSSEKDADSADPPIAPAPPVAANETPDLSGKWHGEAYWGEITLQHRHGLFGTMTVTGNYTDAAGSTGVMALTSSRTRQADGAFEGAWRGDANFKGKISLRLLPDGKTIRGSWTTNPGSKRRAGRPEFADLEWVRVPAKPDATSNPPRHAKSDPDRPAADLPQGAPADRDRAPDFRPNDRLESTGILIEEKPEGLELYSKPLGKRTFLKLPPRSDGAGLMSDTHLSAELAIIRHGNVVYGYSSRTGRAAKLILPDAYAGPIYPEVRAQYAVIQLGEDTHLFTASAGEWSSPNTAMPVSGDEFQGLRNRAATRFGQDIPQNPAAGKLMEQVQAYESAARAEAAQIERLQANGAAEQNKQAIAEHQVRLTKLLSAAFDQKLQWEELQMKELLSRLSRVGEQIDQRKELREKIIQRRARELIEGDTLKWTPPMAPVGDTP